MSHLADFTKRNQLLELLYLKKLSIWNKRRGLGGAFFTLYSKFRWVFRAMLYTIRTKNDLLYQKICSPFFQFDFISFRPTKWKVKKENWPSPPAPSLWLPLRFFAQSYKPFQSWWFAQEEHVLDVSVHFCFCSWSEHWSGVSRRHPLFWPITVMYTLVNF